MGFHWVQQGTALLLSATFAACNAPNIQPPKGPEAPSQSTPSTASQTTPQSDAAQKPAERVVALTPLAADILYQLDKTKLVGIPGSRLLSQKPQFSEIATVSQGQTLPSLETIVALKPDLVVGAAGFHDQTLQNLKQVGTSTLLTRIDSWQSLENVTKTLAEAIQADPAPLLRRYQALLPETPPKGVSTLILVSRQPILAPNKTSWAGDLLTQFNAKNLTADLQGQSPIGGYVTLSPEKILEADPDIIIVVSRELNLLEEFKAQPFWQQLKATQTDQVYVFDYYGLVNPGSIEAIERASQKLKQALGISSG